MRLNSSQYYRIINLTKDRILPLVPLIVLFFLVIEIPLHPIKHTTGQMTTISYPQTAQYFSIGEIRDKSGNLLNQLVTVSTIQITKTVGDRTFWVNDKDDHIFIYIPDNIDLEPINVALNQHIVLPGVRGIVRRVDQEQTLPFTIRPEDWEMLQQQTIYIEIYDCPNLNSSPFNLPITIQTQEI